MSRFKTWYSTTKEEIPLRGAAIHNESGNTDPLLRAIADLRDQIDRLIDEQQAALEGFVSERVGDRAPVDPPVPTMAAEASAVLPPASQASIPGHGSVEETLVPALRVSDPVPKPRRQEVLEVSNPVNDRSDGPSHSLEPLAGARSDDPRERLDALVKHFDRKLRRSGSPLPGTGPPSGP